MSARFHPPTGSQSAVSRDEACRLMRTTDDELSVLLAAAGAVRDDGHGRTITYSRKVFIPLTNLCRDRCGYCTFAKAPRHPEAKTLTPDEVLAIARAGQAQGCKEALFSLGEKPEERYALARAQLARLGYATTTAYLAAMTAMVYEETGLLPHVNCGVLDHDELQQLRDYCASMGLMLETSSDRLLGRGQVHFGCVGKVPRTRLDTMARAAELGIAFTTGILIGIGETLDERVDTLFAIRDLHAHCGNIQEVIIQNFRAKPDIRIRHWPEPTPGDMVRTVAVARLVLGPEMNIQAPPNLAGETSGPLTRVPADWGDGETDAAAACRAYLAAGINDWGGISPVTKDHINPERAWPAVRALAELTAAAGFTLRERLCLYPEYLARPEFVRPHLEARMRELTDASGLVSAAATCG